MIEILELDASTLPSGNYTDAGFESRQVVDIEFQSIVTEYRAQVLVNSAGQRFVAAFPAHVTRLVQYGQGIKDCSVYLLQYQLLPHERICECFADQLGLPLSSGSVYNFIAEAYEKAQSIFT